MVGAHDRRAAQRRALSTRRAARARRQLEPGHAARARTVRPLRRLRAQAPRRRQGPRQVSAPAPTLLRRLLRSQLVVFAVLGAASIAVVVQVGSLAALPPRILADNFRSVQATDEMDRALALLLVDAHDPSARARFARALDDEQHNITEAGEQEAARALAASWTQFLDEPTPARALSL